MKIPRAVIVISFLVCSMIQVQSSFAEGENRAIDWSVAENLFETKCKLCHSIDRPKKARKTPEEWQSTVMRMLSYAPVLTDKEAKLIIDYLSSHYRRQ